MRPNSNYNLYSKIWNWYKTIHRLMIYDTESNMSVLRIPIKYIGQIAVYRKWDSFTCIKIRLSKNSFDLDFIFDWHIYIQ